MPPWAAFAPRSSTLVSRSAIDRLPRAFRSCRNAARHPPFTHLRVRSASTHVAPAAINLRPNIPPQNRELHDAVSALSGAAETWVNISRVQLALSGLAAHDAVTRVAILGLNSQVSAQRLARLLLADPLGTEEKWEKELERASEGSERAVLLKYGDESDAHTPTPLYKVLAIPSRVLRSHNLEILVSTLNVNVGHNVTAASTESSAESTLVPKLQATSARGTPVPYPVHKTLVLGEGLDSAIDFGRFSAGHTEELKDTVKLAIELPAPSDEADVSTQSKSAAINVQVGAKAIATFRESIQNSIAYEHGWFRSGLPTLSNWLVQDLVLSESVKPTLQTLVASIVNDVETKLTKEDVAQLQKLASIPANHDTITSVLGHLESWAEKSHTELRNELDEAFATKSWHKLAWWKLLWRVDDISMISSDILEHRWLVSAEKNSIYLAGRMNQAGFPDDVQKLAVADIPEVTALETAPTAENPRMDLAMSTELRKPRPWLEHIAAARAELINDAVPPLQALAQRLILQTFSTTALSSALTALLYASVSSVSLFEASVVAALGLTFSLRRMQKLWEGGREAWQGTVREEGRRTLKRTEDTVRSIIRTTQIKGPDVVDDGKEERRLARDAVRRVREALEKSAARRV